ncbi:DUF485 domain-containing protein [Burkholderia lata]|uniref:DUF485 domain-containing protein n=1 Tax=Burkholderia lata (strain ATCC 17760 / DSM 23089 / LMG 22485 / NCIMB 9086 / R18194 / 383) TaxID=482957 RepID=UPI001583BCAD|nr:DUF485 domain-containing protein [Burkholderia lata]
MWATIWNVIAHCRCGKTKKHEEIFPKEEKNVGNHVDSGTAASPLFKMLARRRASLTLVLCVAVLVVYYAFILAGSFRPAFLHAPMAKGAVVGDYGDGFKGGKPTELDPTVVKESPGRTWVVGEQVGHFIFDNVIHAEQDDQ